MTIYVEYCLQQSFQQSLDFVDNFAYQILYGFKQAT